MPLRNISFLQKKITATRITCFFWLIGKIMSWKVWLSYRLFPVVPPFDFLFAPTFIHVILFILSLLALILLSIFPLRKILLLSVIIIELLSCLLDQNRWQAWEYQYLFIILALLINHKNERNAISSIAFIFVFIYIFSGIGKMNPAFSLNLQQIANTSGIILLNTSRLYNFFIFHSGYFLGIIEVLLGTGLLCKYTKRIAAVLLIIMHLIIIALFGPWAINYDVIILPWNMAFLMILYVFFLWDSAASIDLKLLILRWNVVFIIFFAMLPVLNFFGRWDFFLSSSLFSFKPPEMYVVIHKQGSSKVLQPFFTVKKSKFINDTNTVFLDVRQWAFKEMLVPAYPEIRVYKNIKSQLLKRYPDMIADFKIYEYIKGQKILMDLK